MMRFVQFVFLSALLFCAVLLPGLHAHAAVSGDFEYMDNEDGTVTITYYRDPVKCNTHLVVPARLDGKTVTAIGDRAFRFACITGVTLPDTVKSIGKEAFEITSILKNVNLPSGLVSIGDYAFNYNRIEQITLPDSLEHIGFSAFSYNKLKSVSFPSGLKTMEPFAFWHNEITSVSFPESMTMTKIPGHTFVENKITSVTIPKYITEIESHAFSMNPITDVKILSAATQLKRDSIAETESQLTVYGHSGSPAQKFAFTNSYLFEPIKMKVIYDGNNHISGDVPVDDKSYVRWDEATVLDNTELLERLGYRFDGWNTAPDGSGEDYAPGSTVSIEEEDVILFAKWVRDAKTPVITDAVTAENRQSTSGLVITPDPEDSGIVKYYKISAIVGGMLYKHDGTTPIANGDFITVAEGGAGLKFTPEAHANSAAGDTFSFQVQAAPKADGTLLSNPVTASIHVTEVNDAPVATDDTLPKVMKGAGKIIIEFADLLINDSAGPANESFQSLTINSVGDAVGGTVEIINGYIEFDLDSAFVGLAKFSYTIQDDGKTDGVDDFKTASAVVSFEVEDKAAIPLANPAGGAVVSGTKVALTSTTEGAMIYYTTDGTTPTSASTLYTGPIEITDPMTIKAIVAKPGMFNSEVMTEQYTLLPLEQAAMPLANPSGGAVASGTKVTLTSTTESAMIYYTTDGTTPTSASTLYTGPIEVTDAMMLKAIAAKLGMLNSEVMMEQYTLLPPEQAAMPLANPAGGAVTFGTKVTLTTTEGSLIYYTTDGTTPTSASTLYMGPIEVTDAMTLKAIASKSGMLNSEVMTEQYTILLPEQQVVKPLASPAGGAVASGTQVTLTTSTEGAVIYYTTDGTTPTSASTLYTGPIEVTDAMTLKAIAAKPGMIDSEVMTEHYTILPPEQVTIPLANPAGGAVVSGTQVTLTTSTDDAVIYYTTDGTTPTSASTLYTVPIEVTDAITLKAIAAKSGMIDSEVMTEQYTLLPREQQAAIPLANPAGGAVASGTQVTLTSSTEGAMIYYTADGTTPTSASTLYTGPIEITGPMTLKAIAVKLGMLNSEMMTEQYTILPREQQAVMPLANPAGGVVTSGTQVTLTTSTEGSMIYYTTDGITPTSASTLYTGPIEITGPLTLKAIAVKSGVLNSEVMTEQYTLLSPEQQAIMPLANPVGGAVASGTQVTLMTSTEGSMIYYTTDGTTPTSASMLYTGAIEITSAMTLKAIAVKLGMLDSEVMTEQYTLLSPEQQAAKPLANPAGGAVASGTQVTLTSSTEGAMIYYTTDSTTPTSASTLYTGPIEITGPLTLKAIAVKSDMLNSEVMTEQYTLLPPEQQAAIPLANPSGGAVASGTQVILTSETEGAVIYYTTDGTTPTSASTLYIGPIEITSAMTLKAIAVKSDMLDSEVMTEQYTLLSPEQEAAMPLANPAGGVVASGTKVTLTSSTEGAVIYYTTDGTTPTSASTLYTGPIEITSAMMLKAIAVKSGMINSEVMTEQYTLLSLEQQTAIPLANPSGGAVASGTQITLTSETEEAMIYYTTDGTTPTSASTLYTGAIEVTNAMTLKAIAAKPGMLTSEVMTEQYTLLPPEQQAAKPLANPAGGAVASGTKVTLTSETEGAMIYYTTDGTTPTSASTLYTGPIEITSAMTLKAIAAKPSMLNSEVMTEQYTFVPIAAPTILTATAGDGFVTLNWTDVAATDTVTYTVYKVAGSAAPSNPNEWVAVQTNVIATTFTVTGLTNGTSYTFAVKASVAGNDSDFSYAATATPRASGGNGGSGGGGSSVSTSGHVTSTNGIIAIPIGSSGKVSLDGEIIIDIPDGAAEQELRITIEKLIDTSDLLTGQEIFTSGVYEVLKNFSGNFKKPVTLSIKFDPSKAGKNQKVAIFYYNEDKKTWIEVGGTVDGEWITVEVDHFTKFAVLAVADNKDDDGEKPKQPSPSFTDIAGHWGEDFIVRAVAQKLVSGYPDGTFKPNNPVTRAEFTVMLVAALKLDGVSTELPFKDQDKIGTWAKRAITLAVHAGIVSGYEDGSFRPNAQITRTEMASMIAKALKLSLEDDAQTGFADNGDIPKWGKGAVEAIRRLGIVSGRGDNKFVPNGTATRAEAVVMLLRMLEYKDNR